MKTTKLVTGILSIIFSVLIGFQSLTVGVLGSAIGETEAGGFFGVILAIIYLTCGILGIVGRNGGSSGYVGGAMYLVGGVLGLILAGSYTDLIVYSWIAIILGIVYIIGTKKQDRQA